MTQHGSSSRGKAPLRILRDTELSDRLDVGTNDEEADAEAGAQIELGSEVDAAWQSAGAGRGRRGGRSTETPAAIGLPKHSTPVADLQAIIDEHERGVAKNHHFRPSRLILINCWVYGYQEFPFVDGHLVLNGGNGSGKTTALTAAMPVALFGTTAPGALDTMDGRARSIEYLVLGDSDDVRDKLNIETGRSTHILWEFHQASTGRYVTVGQILTGSRAGSGGKAGNIDKRGVIIRDGHRVGKTLRTWTFDDNGMMQPWETLEVAEHLVDATVPMEHRNVVTDSHEEFRRTIAREIFGTDNVREVIAYERTLKAMRRPMLNNKEFRPADVADMLRQSLPELDASIIEQMDSALNGLDLIRAQLVNLKTELDATTELRASHNDLVQAHGTELARRVSMYDQQVRGILTNIETERDKQQVALKSRKGLNEKITKERAELGAIEKTISILSQGPGANIAKEHQAASELAKRANQENQNAEERQRREMHNVELATIGEATAVKDRRDAIEHLAVQAEEFRLAANEQRWGVGREAARVLVERCAPRTDDALPVIGGPEAPETLTPLASERRDALRALEAATRAYAKVDEEYRRESGSLAPLNEQVDRAERHFRDASTARDRGRDDAASAILGWESAHVHAIPNAVSVEQLARHVRRFDGSEKDARQLLVPLQTALRDELGRRTALFHDVKNERATRQRELDAKREELEKLKRQDDHRPELAVEQKVVRDALADAGIDAVPLYAAIEISQGAAPTAVALVEQVLIDTGLISTLVINPNDHDRARVVIEQAGGIGGADRWIMSASSSLSYDDGVRALLCAASTSPAAQHVGPAALSRVRFQPESGWDALASPEALKTLWIDISTGSWRYGMSEGRSTTERGDPQFVGLVNRRAERARRIAAMEDMCATLDEVIRRHSVHLATLERDKAAVGEAQTALEALAAIAELPRLISMVRARTGDVEEARRNLTEAEKRIQHLVNRRRDCDEERVKKAIPLPEFRESSLEDLAVALTAAGHWLEIAKRWPKSWSDMTRAADRVRAARVAKARAQEAFEIANDQCSGTRQDLADVNARVLELTRQLESPEVRELQQKLSDLEGRKTDVSKTLEGTVREEARIDGVVQTAEETVIKFTLTLREPQDTRNTSLLAFVGFVRLHAALFPKAVHDLTAFPDHVTVAIAEAVQVPAIVDAYRAAVRQFTGTTSVSHKTLDEASKERERTRDTFSNAFLTRRVHLEVYDIEWARDTNLVTSVVGTTPLTSLAALEAHLTQRLAAQQTVIHQQEDDLYRRVFLSKLSDGLRNQIRETKTTVAQLNDVLAHRPLHDLEVLSVEWRPITISRRRGKEREGDLWSTEEDVALRREVVNILTMRDLQNASNEAQETVYQYFRGRLNALREKYGRPGEKPGFTRLDGCEVRSFRDVLANAFDYRQWYEFGIMSQMPDVPTPQEITDERFVRRSGGQRVSATLVPLLAALEVRCRAFGATSPAPRLIALDEAFAGVDEENTEALFKTLEVFDMSWIMTSDKLTGASPALSGAMTVVLSKRVRSDAPSVVAANYLVWDGTFEFDSETAAFRTAMIAQRDPAATDADASVVS